MKALLEPPPQERLLVRSEIKKDTSAGHGGYK
jgi:hypothetical protein